MKWKWNQQSPLKWCSIPPNEEFEDVHQVFFGCQWSRHLWRITDFPFIWENCSNSVWECLETIDQTDMKFQGKKNYVWFAVSAILYTIWFVRNSMCMNSKAISPEGFIAIYRKIKSKWNCEEDYSPQKIVQPVSQNFCTEGCDMETPATPKISHPALFRKSADLNQWCMNRPPPGWAVVLTDAAFSDSERTAAFGVIIINRDGVLLAKKEVLYNGVIAHVTEEAELLALECGVDWAFSLKFQNIICLSDSLSVINNLNHRTATWQLLPIQEHLRLLREDGKCLFRHVPRSLDVSAHNAAKHSLQSRSSCCSYPIPPVLFSDFTFVDD